MLCFTRETSVTPAVDAIIAVRNAGGLGVIIARNPTHLLLPSRNFPSVAVDFELGTDILFYIRSTRYHSSHSPNTFMNYHNIFGFFSLARSPIVKIGASRTLVARPVATKVATFSSRGPSSISPAILKVYQLFLFYMSILLSVPDFVCSDAAGYSSTWCEHTCSYFP